MKKAGGRLILSRPPSDFRLRPYAASAPAAAGGGLLRVLRLTEGAAGGVGLVARAGALVERDEAFEDGARAGLEPERGLVVFDRLLVAPLVFENARELEVRVVLARAAREVLVGVAVA